MLEKLHVVMLCPLDRTLAAFGEQALTRGRTDLSDACMKSGARSEKRIRVKVSARDFFAAAVEQCRERGEAKTVEALEALLAELKAGTNRKILGSFNMTAGETPGEIMGQLERLGQQVIANRGG